MNARPFLSIRQKFHTLSEEQKRIAQFILDHKERSVLMSIRELAGECGLSETTVVRFIRKLEYDSYRTFRVEMARELSGLDRSAAPEGLKIEDGYQDLRGDDSMEEIRRKVSRSAASAIQDMAALVDASSLEAAVDLLQSAGRVLFFGSGGSSVIAMDAHHKFLRLGLDCAYEGVSHFAIIRAAHLGPEDALVVFSHTGESRESLECARNARAAGCRIIALTSYLNSSLAQAADIVLYSSTNELPHYTDAMVSRLIQLVIMDMLFVALSFKLGAAGKEAIGKSRLAIAPSKSRASTTTPRARRS